MGLIRFIGRIERSLGFLESQKLIGFVGFTGFAGFALRPGLTQGFGTGSDR